MKTVRVQPLSGNSKVVDINSLRGWVFRYIDKDGISHLYRIKGVEVTNDIPRIVREEILPNGNLVPVKRGFKVVSLQSIKYLLVAKFMSKEYLNFCDRDFGGQYKYTPNQEAPRQSTAITHVSPSAIEQQSPVQLSSKDSAFIKAIGESLGVSSPSIVIGIALRHTLRNYNYPKYNQLIA